MIPLTNSVQQQEVESSIPLPSSKTKIETLKTEVTISPEKETRVLIDLSQVFSGSPMIYTGLILLSLGSFFFWLYPLNLAYV